MSNYPGTLDVFVNKTGSDNIASSDPNNAFDGVEATQGLLGALGKPQSWSTTLLTALRMYQRGLRVESPGGTLYVRSGEAVLESTDGNLHVFRQNAGDVTLSTTEIDAGAIAATFYYVYMYGGAAATTGPIIYSTDALSPYGIGTAPYKKIGWFNNAIAASLTPTFAGAWKDGSNEPNICFTAETALTAIVATTAYIDDVTSVVNFISSGRPVKITGSIDVSHGATGARAQAAISLDGTDQTITETAARGGTGATSGTQEHLAPMMVGTLAAGAHVAKLRYRCSQATMYARNRQLIIEEV